MSKINLQEGMDRLAEVVVLLSQKVKNFKSKDDLTTYPSDNDFLANTESGAIGLKEVNGHPNIIVNFAGTVGEWPEWNNFLAFLNALEDRLQKQIDINFADIKLNKDEIELLRNSINGGPTTYHYGTIDDANAAKATTNFKQSDIAWIGTSGDWVGYHFIGGNWVANNTTSTHAVTLDAYSKAETNTKLAEKQNNLTAAQLEILAGIKFTQAMLDKLNSAIQAHQDISGKQDALTADQLAILAGKVFTEAEKTKLLALPAIDKDIFQFTVKPDGTKTLQIGKGTPEDPMFLIEAGSGTPYIGFNNQNEANIQTIAIKDIASKQELSAKQNVLTADQLAILAGKVFTEAEKTDLAHFIQFKAAIDLAINHSAKFSHLPANTNDELAKKQNLLTAAQLAILAGIAFTQADKDKIDGMDAKYMTKSYKFKPHATKQPNLIVLNDNGIATLPLGTKITLDLAFIDELLGTPGTVPAAADQLFIGQQAVRIPNAVGTAALKWETKTNPTDINVKDNYATKNIVLQKVEDNGNTQWNFVELVDKEHSYAFDDLSNVDPIQLLIQMHKIDDMTDFTTTLVNIPAWLFEHAKIKSLNAPNAEKIGMRSFYYYAGTILNLPKVIEIDDFAFQNAFNLITINAPLLQKIGNTAFYNFGGTTLDLPELLELGDRVFYNAKKLTTINLPKLQKIIGAVFYNFAGTTVDLPEVLEIGDKAFYFARAITTVNLPKVISIGTDAFNRIVNASTTTVTMPSQFNTDAEKNRIFGTGHWNNITFTYTADTSANAGGIA